MNILSQKATFTEDNLFRRSIRVVLFVVCWNFAEAGAQPMRDVTRSELLYSTHCVFCHSTQVHWRDKRLATDWTSLQSQVRRWQENSALGWSNEDIAGVAQYLNDRYYRYPAPN